MILLDTNVISEPLRPRPDTRVVNWLAAHSEVALCSVSVGELIVGARMLPHGKRREALLVRIEAVISGIAGRILEYDVASARMYAELREHARRSGRSLSVEDGMIAAIARVHGCELATRNVRDFEGLGLRIVDPWTPEPGILH